MSANTNKAQAKPAPNQESIITKLKASKQELLEEYQATHSSPWIIGYSGGKDSTFVLQLAFEMLLDLSPSERTRHVHVVANDTLVESPLIRNYVNQMLDKLTKAVKGLGLPITVKKTIPELDQTFWVNTIGKGYPPPNRNFRWCTDRMKIQPTSTYITQQVAANGQIILLLGVRRSESAARAAIVDKHSNGERLHPHSNLKGCLIFRPILHFDTDEVWQVLLQRNPPWGGSHRELVTLYRNAQGGECPLVIDESQAPSCGSSSSRFGCWTCTVVTKDHSMEGFIDSGFDYLEPLLDYRDWLAEIRDDKTRRMAVRRNGSPSFMSNGELVPGPFTIETRQEMLTKLLAVQEEVGENLISQGEVDLIKHIWNDDITKQIAGLKAAAQ